MTDDMKREDDRDPTRAKSDESEVIRFKGSDWQTPGKVVQRKFPGVVRREVPLRIAIDAAANSELHLHANEDLNREVCGVLVGETCVDEAGPFVHVQAVVRGTSAKSGAAHVTYTQETWQQIHGEMEKQHAKQQIVGWYHTHPGFGVTFSDMDEFIQQNFFPGETQIAVVLDPLLGQIAAGVNLGDEFAYASHVWVGGRERVCSTPSSDVAVSTSLQDDGRLGVISDRLGRVLEAIEDQRTTVRRAGGTLLFAVLLLVCMWIVFSVVGSFRASEVHRPELRSYVPVPVRIGDKTVLLGLHVVQWEIPPELNAILIEQAERTRAAEDERKKAAEPNSDPPPDQTQPDGE